MPDQSLNELPATAVILGLQRVADLNDEIIFMKDKHGRLTYINTAGALLLGKSAAEIVGKDETELIDPSTGFESWESDHKVFTSGAAQQGDISWLIGDRAHPLRITKYPLTNEGEVIGILAIGHPRDPQVRNRLKKTTGQLRLANPGLQNGFVDLEKLANSAGINNITIEPDQEEPANLTGMLLSLQAAMLSVASSLDQQHILDTMTWEIAQLLNIDYCIAFGKEEQTNMLQALSVHGDIQKEGMVQRFDLAQYPLFMKAMDERRPLPLSLSTDAAVMKKHRLLAEIEIKSLLILPMIFQDELVGLISLLEPRRERLFTDWEISLASLLASQSASSMINARLYAQLDRTNIALRASNEELDAYAHTVAHDLKGPLSIISGFSDIILNDVDNIAPTEMIEFLQIIASNGIKMKEIINGLLLLSTVRQGEIVHEDLNMILYVLEAKSRVTQQFMDEPFEIHIPEDFPAARGYGPWIEEVWTNYLSNAIKYGGRPAIIQVGASIEAEGMVRYWVQDNGNGLTREQQKKIFTPFTRLHQTAAEGHGLGLSIVRRIVEKLGGQVGIESNVGQGSKFFFTLPSSLE